MYPARTDGLGSVIGVIDIIGVVVSVDTGVSPTGVVGAGDSEGVGVAVRAATSFATSTAASLMTSTAAVPSAFGSHAETTIRAATLHKIKEYGTRAII